MASRGRGFFGKVQTVTTSQTDSGETEQELSQIEPDVLSRARSRFLRAKLVAFACVAAVLLLANTTFLSESARFIAGAAALAIGSLAFIVGARYFVQIPRLEREALEHSAPPVFMKVEQEQRHSGDA